MSEDFLTPAEYSKVMGSITEIWLNNEGKNNEDVLHSIVTAEGLNDRQRVYMAFIHGIEITRHDSSKPTG